MPDEQKKNLHLDDPDGYMAHIYFWEQVQRRAKYTEVWNEVKAAP
jgi:putative spermidine/putrescine transport system substrate-binding protein/spermidine/putrescine transport system substrate-binding protein